MSPTKHADEFSPLIDAKLAIRTESRWVVAYCSNLEGTEREELGRILEPLLDGLEGPVFSGWRDAMIAAFTRFIEVALDTKVSDVVQSHPSLLEGKGSRQ